MTTSQQKCLWSMSQKRAMLQSEQRLVRSLKHIQV